MAIVSSPDPTYERGSGDIRLIPWGSLMLITFWREISLRQSHCRTHNLGSGDETTPARASAITFTCHVQFCDVISLFRYTFTVATKFRGDLAHAQTVCSRHSFSPSVPGNEASRGLAIPPQRLVMVDRRATSFYHLMRGSCRTSPGLLEPLRDDKCGFIPQRLLMLLEVLQAQLTPHNGL